MRISRKKFDSLVERAIAMLPEEFARWIDEVPIIVEDAPRPLNRDEEDALGLYQGGSLLERLEDSGQLPPRILLFRRPLMDNCDTLPALAEEIRKTLLHELGHHAGMNEEDLEHLGYGPPENDHIEWNVDEDGADNESE
jgi:predicted Zn-dependent protease with MMP-like domain